MLRSDKPVVVALGTGRAVRAAVERVSPIDRPNHQIVSLVGNISADGSASFFDTVGRLADLTRSRHYPMPLPFLMSSDKERDQMLRMEPICQGEGRSRPRPIFASSASARWISTLRCWSTASSPGRSFST